MSLELDHVFIIVEPEAMVADLLIEKGFREGTRNKHPGQGSSNRRFYFANGMLEFLWIHDAEEAVNGPGRDLRLQDRATAANASPFGVILRSKNSSSSEHSEMPFNGWTYQPLYFDPPNAFHIGANSQNISEPLCIYFPFSMLKSSTSKSEKNTSFTISNVSIYTPSEDTKEILNAVNQAERLAIKNGKEHLMEITLNNHEMGCIEDFRPEIPLIMYW